MAELQEKTLSAYWSAMVFTYTRVANAAIRLLMPFPLTWLCETDFSALLEIKNKTRTKLIVQPDQRCALPTTGPRIDKRVVKCSTSRLTDAINSIYESLFNRVVSYVSFNHCFVAIAHTCTNIFHRPKWE